MTLAQLTILEALLENRGYRKWTNAKVGNEDYDWFKTVPMTSDPYDDPAAGYQMAFRVWDWTEYPDSLRPEYEEYGVEFWASLLGSDGRIELNASWRPIRDVAAFERMAAEFYELTKRHGK